MKSRFAELISVRLVAVAKPLTHAKFRNVGPVHLIVASAVLLALCTAIGTGLYLYDLRNRAIASQERNLANTALIVAKQIEHIFKTVEEVQKDIIEQAAEIGNSGAENFERQLSGHNTYVKLRDKAAGMPYVGSLTLFNYDGRLINLSRQWPVPVIDVIDREYFKAFQSDPDLASYISEPVVNRANGGSWVVHFVRKIAAADGTFLGLTSAAIELKYLQDSFSQIVIQPGSGISLFRTDGTLMARVPRVESEIASRVPGVVGLKLTANADHGVGISKGIIDGNVRIIAAHRVGNYPMVISATKIAAIALADWRRTAQYGILAGALIIVGIAAFAILFVKLIKNY
jgi:hypothetical protein